MVDMVYTIPILRIHQPTMKEKELVSFVGDTMIVSSLPVSGIALGIKSPPDIFYKLNIVKIDLDFVAIFFFAANFGEDEDGVVVAEFDGVAPPEVLRGFGHRVSLSSSSETTGASG